MKLNIDDRILKIYSDLPDTFKIKDVVDLTGNKLNYHTVRYQVEAMLELGMIDHFPRSPRKYIRLYSDLPRWIREYVRKIK